MHAYNSVCIEEMILAFRFIKVDIWSHFKVQIIVKLLSRLSKTLNTLTGYTKREGVSKVVKDEASQAEMKSDIKSPISREIDHQSVSSTSNTDQQDVISVSTTEFSVPIDQANFVSTKVCCIEGNLCLDIARGGGAQFYR